MSHAPQWLPWIAVAAACIYLIFCLCLLRAKEKRDRAWTLSKSAERLGRLDAEKSSAGDGSVP